MQNVSKYEEYLDGVPLNEDSQLLEGKCTPEGTRRFVERALKNDIPSRNFRKPILEGQEFLNLSTVGLGTYLGLPDDATDFDVYNAAKLLVLSGGVNVLDTAINYRCQKGERSLGAAIKTMVQKHGVSRDELFIATKNGYIPDDADKGKSAAMLIQELIEEEKITKEDVAAEIHSMHPNFLEHQLQCSKTNLGLQTIDLMYLHNAYESWSHFLSHEEFMDKLAKAFEFFEQKR